MSESLGAMEGWGGLLAGVRVGGQHLFLILNSVALKKVAR